MTDPAALAQPGTGTLVARHDHDRAPALAAGRRLAFSNGDACARQVAAADPGGAIQPRMRLAARAQ